MIAQHQQIDQELMQVREEICKAPSQLPPQVGRILDYVHAHLFDPELNVKVVKAQCRCYDNNITLRFRSTVGTGLRDYIEQLRMEAADRLLVSHRYPIYLVAMAVGYSYPETFCRAFQRQFGRQPSFLHVTRRQIDHQDKRSRRKIKKTTSTS